MCLTRVFSSLACIGALGLVGLPEVGQEKKTQQASAAKDERPEISLLRQAEDVFRSKDAELARQVAKASSASLRARLAGRVAEFESIDQKLMALLLSRKHARHKYLSQRSILLERSQPDESTNERKLIAEEKQKLQAAITTLQESRSRRWLDTEVESNVTAALRGNRARKKIAAALAAPTEPIQGGDSLKSLLDFISDVHGFPIIQDRGQLADAGIDSLQAITVCEDLSLSEIRLSNALDIVLEHLDGVDEPLDYIIEHEVVKITTREAAHEHLEDCVYSLALTATDPDPEQLHGLLKDLLITEGEDSIPVSIHRLGNKLVVRHNQRGHRKVLELLTKLGIRLASNKADAAEPEASAKP